MRLDASKLERLRRQEEWSGSGPLGWLGSAGRCWWLPPAMSLAAATTAPAQTALRTAMATEAATEARQAQPQPENYTIKTEDFMLQVSPGMEVDWNDNINLTKTNPQADCILTPLIMVNSSYRIGAQNRLNLAVDLGYEKYTQHDELSRWYVGSQSALSFDVYVKNFKINLHDQVHYTQDSAQEAAVAGSGNYGTFGNTAGLAGTWDLENVSLSLGYDHQNLESISGQYSQMNGATEMAVAKAAWQMHPKLTLGWESSASFATYEEKLLNDYQAYSGGIFGEWRPGSFLTIRPRAGLVFFDSSQTSAAIRAQNLASWYGDLTLAHKATDFLNCSLSAGREIQPGVESDAIADYYVRPSLNWDLIKHVTLQTSLFYEHGAEGAGQEASLTESSFDWYGSSLSLSYSPMKEIKISLNYRLTLRSSNVATREYTQNLVGLQFAYIPK